MIDIAAILIICIIGQVFSIVIFVYYLVTYGNIDSKIRLYSFGKILQFLGPFLSMVFANNLTPTIMTITIAFFYPGLAIEAYCLVYFNKIPKRERLWIYLLISTVFVATYALVSSNVIIRVVVTSSYYSIVFFILFFKTVFPLTNSGIHKLIGMIALLASIVNIFRVIFTVFSGVHLDLFHQSIPQVLFLLVFVIIAFTFPLLFLLILQEKVMQELHELNVTKNKLFKIIGHDLKAPLAQMVMFTETIEENFEEMDKKSLLTFIKEFKKSSSRGFNLLENLLNWSISQTGQISFKPETISITNIIDENVALLAKIAKNKEINIHVGVSNIKPVELDKNMISTVVRNLISNAIKYSYPGGEVDITSSVNHGNLIFSIKDTGIGIPVEACDNLFRIENNCSTRGTQNEKGTGIGLVLCKEFIDRHHGKIWVESEPNHGSSFSFSIPVTGKLPVEK
ncbi:MAG: HAMP domain-containing histidine kinase [Bacteroidales bacterium]|nr:HAMP domain-containing histidine kinase [Bacteroidales bacterium]